MGFCNYRLLEMKRTLLLFSIVFLFHSSLVLAQDAHYRSEVTASTGLVLIGLPKTDSGPKEIPFVYDISYKYSPRQWFSLGLSVGNNHLTYYGDTKSKVLFTSFLSVNWLRKQTFIAYSGLGYIIVPDSMNHFDLSRLQMTALGVSFGQKFYGMAELGIGGRYFPLRLGIGYRFH